MQFPGQVAPPCARQRDAPNVAARLRSPTKGCSPPAHASPTLAPSDDVFALTVADMATERPSRPLTASNATHHLPCSMPGGWCI